MPNLFDSSSYITALRVEGDAALLLQRWACESPLWLSSVVLEELYAGTNQKNHRILDRLERDFGKAGRILVPNLTDWTYAGKFLPNFDKYEFERIGQARMTNDALIAASAARIGATVLTPNQRNFARLAEFCPLNWQVRPIQAH